jgi:hypothetical protein
MFKLEAGIGFRSKLEFRSRFRFVIKLEFRSRFRCR